MTGRSITTLAIVAAALITALTISDFIIPATRIIDLSFMIVLLTLIISITYAKILNKTCDFSFKMTIGNGVSEIYTKPDNSK